MRSDVPEKLLAIVDEIDTRGHANLTRLTVLKKWFEHPGRLSAFGLWVARRSAARKGRTKAEAGALLNEARMLLGSTATRDSFLKPMDRDAAQALRRRARDFQNDFKEHEWGAARIIHCWPLFLVEQGLGLHLEAENSPPAGYKLAADFCQHYTSRYGNSLCGPGRTKIMEIVRFMLAVESIEEEHDR